MSLRIHWPENPVSLLSNSTYASSYLLLCFLFGPLFIMAWALQLRTQKHFLQYMVSGSTSRRNSNWATLNLCLEHSPQLGRVHWLKKGHKSMLDTGEHTGLLTAVLSIGHRIHCFPFFPQGTCCCLMRLSIQQHVPLQLAGMIVPQRASASRCPLCSDTGPIRTYCVM